MSIFTLRQKFSRFAGVIVCLALTLPSSAVQPGNGFFTGVELEPLANAVVSDVEKEPAVALIFAAEQKTAEITQKFDAWYSSPSRPDVQVFAIAVNPNNLSRDLIVEAINQRQLKMPVFLATADMLLGDDFRLVVLDDDQELRRFTSLDFAGENDALSSLGIAIPAAANAPAATATPAPAVTVEPAAPPPPEPTAIPAAPAHAESMIFGGPNGDPDYRNDVYGFTARFPSRWSYQVAARQDGAVAIPPSGSRIDMRVWALPAENIDTPQHYIDQSLDSLARKHRTRVNVDRKFTVRDGTSKGLDIGYLYTKPLNPDAPAAGGLLYRGRMQVYVHDGYVKAAAVEAPTGEFSASANLIEAFFLSFTFLPGTNGATSGYTSPIL